jgi:hypothetical protein
MTDNLEPIDIEAIPITPSEGKITPILEIGLTEDSKSLACKQLHEFEFSGIMVNAMCQLIIDFFAEALPEDKKEDFKIVLLDLILQTRDAKKAQKPIIISP